MLSWKWNCCCIRRLGVWCVQKHSGQGDDTAMSGGVACDRSAGDAPLDDRHRRRPRPPSSPTTGRRWPTASPGADVDGRSSSTSTTSIDCTTTSTRATTVPSTRAPGRSATWRARVSATRSPGERWTSSSCYVPSCLARPPASSRTTQTRGDHTVIVEYRCT